MEDKSLFPLSFFYENRNMQVKVDYDPKAKRFTLSLNSKSYFELQHHMTGQIELNSVKFLDGRMPFSIESMRKLKR